MDRTEEIQSPPAMPPLTPDDLDAIELLHQVYRSPKREVDTCGECQDEWPCDAVLLVARVRALEAGLREALPYVKTVSRNDQGGYSERTPDLYERLVALLAARAEAGA